jgi:hypothetical protein
MTAPSLRKHIPADAQIPQVSQSLQLAQPSCVLYGATYNANVVRPDAITNRGGRSAQQHVNGRRVEGHPSLDLGGPSQRKPARKRAFGPSFLPAFFVFPLWLFLLGQGLPTLGVPVNDHLHSNGANGNGAVRN